MEDAERIATLKRYLRRTYAANVPGLKSLAASVAERATKAVTITGQTFEGGSAQGTVTFEPMAYLAAIEDVIAELDDSAPLAAPNSALIRFQ